MWNEKKIKFIENLWHKYKSNTCWQQNVHMISANTIYCCTKINTHYVPKKFPVEAPRPARPVRTHIGSRVRYFPAACTATRRIDSFTYFTSDITVYGYRTTLPGTVHHGWFLQPLTLCARITPLHAFTYTRYLRGWRHRGACAETRDDSVILGDSARRCASYIIYVYT